MKTNVLAIFLLTYSLYSCGQSPKETATVERPDKVVKTDEQWRAELDAETYHVTREKGTERAFTGKYNNFKEKGSFVCSNCGNILFHSDHKFDSGTGWPSFYTTAGKGGVGEIEDKSFGWSRVEVVCNRCDAHLGHVFNDGPSPTGMRYCINSVSLNFEPESSEK